MLLGLLYHRTEDLNLKQNYLNAAEQVMPEDYAVYELRAELLLKIGRYHEALDNAFRLFLMCHNGSYAAYQGTMKARMAAEKLGYPLTIYSSVEQQVLGRVFELSDSQRKLFEHAIATGKREKAAEAPAENK